MCGGSRVGWLMLLWLFAVVPMVVVLFVLCSGRAEGARPRPHREQVCAHWAAVLYPLSQQLLDGRVARQMMRVEYCDAWRPACVLPDPTPREVSRTLCGGGLFPEGRER